MVALVGPTRAVISVFGFLLMLGGLIFTLQGFGVVGPSGSFMFESRQWTYNGIIVFIAGLVVLSLGLGLKRTAKQQLRPTEQDDSRLRYPVSPR